MTLDDVYSQLVNGEMRHLYMDAAGVPVAELPVDKRRHLLWSIQLGLTELHKRFLLREGEFTLDLVDGQQSYVLDKRYAQSNTQSTETNKYIDDAQWNFVNDLIKVERAYDAEGTELSINIVGDEDSLRTPTYNSLIVPTTNESATIRVIYRADHPAISPQIASGAPIAVDIQLPPSYLEALLFYVAARALTPVGMVNEFHEGSHYTMKFENSCALLNATGFKVETAGINNRLERNGWV